MLNNFVKHLVLYMQIHFYHLTGNGLQCVNVIWNQRVYRQINPLIKRDFSTKIRFFSIQEENRFHLRYEI